MTKKLSILFSSLLVFSFLQIDCKDDPPVKDNGTTFPDTTSHNFTFYVDTLGDGGSSVLFDVAIVKDTHIYAVGEIFRKDSTGDYENPPYNFCIWDGEKWIIQRIAYQYQNTPFYGEIRWLYVHKEHDVWFGNSVHWNGSQFQNVNIGNTVFQGIGSTRMWGNISTNFYVVGNKGTVAMYDGVSWQSIQTSTTLDFKDIWGDKNPTTGEYEIYAVASKGSFSSDRKIYRISGTTATEVSTDGIPYSTNCIWFKSQKQYYIAGGGMWKKDNILANAPWRSFESGVTPYYIYGMRGQSENDIVAVGSFGELLHYNGKSWKSFRDLPGFNNLELYAVDIKGDVICAVGYIGSRACVVRGYR